MECSNLGDEISTTSNSLVEFEITSSVTSCLLVWLVFNNVLQEPVAFIFRTDKNILQHVSIYLPDYMVPQF
jgi:hypothetical protein